MKKSFFYLGLTLLAAVLVTSCTKDEDQNPFQELEAKGAVVNITDVDGFFDLTDPNATVTFTISTLGESVSSLKVWKSINGATPVEQGTVSSFPSVQTYSVNDAVAGTGVSAGDLAVGDVITYSFSDVVTSSGTFPAGKSVGYDVKCPSDLGGIYDFSTESTGTAPWTTGVVTTGKIRFDDLGSGTYDLYTTPTGGVEFLDISMGAYFGGWGYDGSDATNQNSMPNTGLSTGRVQLSDLCNTLSFKGASQWGETYTFNNVSVDGTGTVLTLDWINSYGEGGIAKITRTDGTTWPPLTK
ncbi:MAG: hypothetical protein R2825_22780 [Saprospiraceae bacterium]